METGNKKWLKSCKKNFNKSSKQPLKIILDSEELLGKTVKFVFFFKPLLLIVIWTIGKLPSKLGGLAKKLSSGILNIFPESVLTVYHNMQKQSSEIKEELVHQEESRHIGFEDTLPSIPRQPS